MKEFNLKLTKNTKDINNRKNNFYLGTWSLPDIEINNLNQLSVNEYHWNDRDKLLRDYNGLNDYIFNNFSKISKYMNEITGVSKDERYWKINLGNWIGLLIQVLFDRWETIRTLPNLKFSLVKTSIDVSLLRPNTVYDFFSEIHKDEWNEAVYRLIINVQNLKINYEQTETLLNKSFYKKKKFKFVDMISYFKFKIINFFFSFIHKLQNPKYFIIASYLSILDELKVKLLLKQIPIKYLSLVFHPRINYKDVQKNNIASTHKQIKLKIRDNSKWEISNKNFLNWFEYILPYFIPHNYYNNFKKFRNDMLSLPFPERPKVIFTSNLYNQYDYFNLYTSENVSLGSKYIIGQHGGTFRSSEINYSELIQKSIPDYYLIWGEDNQYNDLSKSKTFPVGNLKTSSLKIKEKNYSINRFLLLTVDLPKYSFMLASIPISSQNLIYYNDIKIFLDKISDFKLFEKVILRHKFRELSWDLGKKILQQFPNMNCDKIADYYKSIYSSSLVISTSNGSTYLETMSLNIPTVFFWNPNYWELRKSAINDYNELIDVGIFHTDPSSAAEHIFKIESNISKWWFSDKVQIARKNFCKKYSKRNENLPKEIAQIIKYVAS